MQGARLRELPNQVQVCARTITTTTQADGGSSSTVVETIPRINVNPKCAALLLCPAKLAGVRHTQWLSCQMPWTQLPQWHFRKLTTAMSCARELSVICVASPGPAVDIKGS
jgi:hypothetical protein